MPTFTKYGIYLGLGLIITSFVCYFISPRFFLTWGSWIGFILYIIMMVMAVKEEKFNLGSISFKGAFGQSWLTYVVGTLIATIFAYIMMHFIDPTLMDTANEIAKEAIEKMSGFLGEEGVEKALEAIDKQDTYSVFGFVRSYLIGLIFPGAIIALIIAAIMKNKSADAEPDFL
ncbi:MAG: DUF4199 domain-containing protein [Lewinellaceae bacterium]|nr:DUF4199 domain-containing protein [Lewinellaceae bacterium]